MGETLVFAGDLATLCGPAAPGPLPPPPDTAVLLLITRPRPDHRGRTHGAVVTTGAELPGLISADGSRAVGAAVPLDRLRRHSPLVTAWLPPSPLLHAARPTLLGMLEAFLRVPTPQPAAEAVVVSLIRGLMPSGPTVPVVAPGDDDFERRVTELVRTRHRDPSFDVDALARELCISRRHLYRRVTGSTGIADMIARQRVLTARRLIQLDPALPLAEVARLSGFYRPANMRAQFVARLGITPSAYRELALQGGMRRAGRPRVELLSLRGDADRPVAG
ncbi:AraC family transcriptional regulator [Microbacterium luticocti]|uniref:AraC family transcriptional regulator n=1 Tax=Microbacterium luticocti TaxID=451764 RepID=UPI000686E160|nr:helix-turn-helix domain-containing protein [Microbacterium luticocti]